MPALSKVPGPASVSSTISRMSKFERII
jgi:hypothetical protein